MRIIGLCVLVLGRSARQRSVGANESRTGASLLACWQCTPLLYVQQGCDLFGYLRLSVAKSTCAKRVQLVNLCTDTTADRYHGSSLMLQLPSTAFCTLNISSRNHSLHCSRSCRRGHLDRSAASKTGTGFGVPNNTSPGKPIQLAKARGCSSRTT